MLPLKAYKPPGLIASWLSIKLDFIFLEELRLRLTPECMCDYSRFFTESEDGEVLVLF